MLTAVSGKPAAADPGGTTPPDDRATVAVIIPTFNHAHFLAKALKSVVDQTRPADEVIVVDDGSTDNPAEVVAQFPNVRLIRQENRGLAGARNTGLRSCTTTHVVFLDADDMLLPNALEAGLTCFADHSDCAFVYGGHRAVADDGRHLYDLFRAIDGDAHLAMLRRNEICMIATVLFRRDCLLAEGGFDESLRRCEDVDIYLRITHKYPIAGYPTIVAEYLKHNENMSNDNVAQLKAILAVLDRHENRIQTTPATRAALQEGRAQVRDLYAYRMIAATSDRWRALHSVRLLTRDLIQSVRLLPSDVPRMLLGKIVRRASRLLPRFVMQKVQQARGKTYSIPPGLVRFGDLKRSSPISESFGRDRGTPIDRHYIEIFLAQNQGHVRGRVLEADDNVYTRRFGGGRVEQSDVISVETTNPRATIVGDLTHPGSLPEEAFDCIVLTQTLQFIYDVQAAVRTLYRALKPGGVLLLTVPGLSKMHDKWPWYWSFKADAVRCLLEEQFGQDLSVGTHGNILAATAFLYGIAAEEFNSSELSAHDPSYPVIVSARAIKRPKA